MPSRRRVAAAIAALLVAAPAGFAPALAGGARAASLGVTTDAAVDPAVAAQPKVVIVVGATESTTPSYRSDADTIAAEALKYTANVIRIYSPNATWATVKAAAQGASIFVYLGHGYGYPSPYRPVLSPDVQDGMGLNAIGGVDDWDKKYYGESSIASEIRFARNAVVLLNHLCYSAGSSESGDPEPTINVAKERVDNFASGWIKAGARLVIAQSWTSGVIYAIRSIFTTNQTVGQMWLNAPNRQGHVIPFVPLRNPQFRGALDPDTWTTGFHRSFVGAWDMPTSAVLSGATDQPTGVDPASFQAPGAASVGAAAVPLYADQDLTTASGATLAASTKVRVEGLVSEPALLDGTTAPPNVSVKTFDGATAGWAAGGGLVPRDSLGPQLWAVDGATDVTPNADGVVDGLNLLFRFSERVSWSASVLDGGGTALRTVSGSGDLANLTWDAKVGGAFTTAGDYRWAIHATDAWGNPALDEAGTFTVSFPPTPDSGVLAFVPTTPSPTRSSTVAFALTFAGPVTGLAAADFTKTGTSPGCVVGTPTGTGTSWAVTLTNCGTGGVGLTLNSGSVLDGALVAGPGGPISAPAVVVDRTAPKAVAPRPGLRTGLSLTSTSTAAPILGLLTWSGTDTGGAGVGSYDVARSYDGGTFAIVASYLASPSLAVSMTPGHSYRFEVRTRDKAGNVSGWAAASTWYPALTQQTSSSLGYGGSWGTVYDASMSGGSARYAAGAGASVSYTFNGRAVSWVTTRRPSTGQVRVYVDGSYVATIDTYAASTTYRYVAFSRAWSAYGTHTVKLVVVGTSGRPRAEVDAFEVLR